MNFQRSYDDGKTWELVDEVTVMRRAAQHSREPEFKMAVLRNGGIVMLGGVLYKALTIHSATRRPTNA